MRECGVVGVYDYPVRGAAGRAHSQLRIDPAVGVLNDRRHAFKKVASMPDEWASKSAFFVGTNTALLVAQVPAFVKDKDGNEQLDPRWLEEVAKPLGVKKEADGRSPPKSSSISARTGCGARSALRRQPDYRLSSTARPSPATRAVDN